MKSLIEYRSDLEAFCKSREYQKECKNLNDNISEVRGMFIAVDLEGTLTSTNIAAFQHNPDGNNNQSTIQHNPDLIYIRRPFSNEFLKELAKNNRLRLWTAANYKCAVEIIQQTGLILPEKMGIIDRTITANRVNFLRLIKLEKILFGDMSIFDEYIINGIGKIPFMFGIHMLIDDQAAFHKYCCSVVGKGEEAGKIVQIEPFKLENEEDFENIGIDKGIINIASTLAKIYKYAERCAQ